MTVFYPNASDKYGMSDMTKNTNQHTLTKYLLIIFGVGVLFWRCWFLYNEQQNLHLLITVNASKIDQGQLYFDRGFGFNEHDSVVTQLIQKAQKKWEKNLYPISYNYSSSQYFIFDLPSVCIDSFRLVSFLSKNQYIDIENIYLVDGLGGHQKTIRFIKAEDSSGVIDIDDVLSRQGKPVASGQKIIIDPQLDLRTCRVKLGEKYWSRMAVETFLLLFLCFLYFYIKSRFGYIITINSYKKYILSHLNICVNCNSGFIVLAILYCYFYSLLNERLFPVIFEKILLFIIMFLVFKYINQRFEEFLNLRIFLSFAFSLIAISLISSCFHYFALIHLNLASYIAVVDGTNGGVLFSKIKAIQSCFDNKVTSDQAIFIIFFPLLILLSVSIFRQVEHSWKLLIFIPCIFLPNIVCAIYQVDGIGFVPGNGDVGFSGEITSFRIMLFLLCPFGVLGAILSKKWWKRLFFISVVLVILWLLRLTVGRAAILGVILFLLSIPIISLWVQRFQNKKRIIIYSGILCLSILLVFVGFMIPKYHGFMSKIVTERLVSTNFAFLDGIGGKSESNYLDNEPRPEMQHQALQLFKSSPFVGLGPAAFQNNSAKIRYTNGDRPGISHAITNLYLFMATNFGVLGLIAMLGLHFIPLLMVFSVRQCIDTKEDRWAVGIVFTTVTIMLILFHTNLNISLPVVNWCYSIYLGFLLSIALKYGYKHNRKLPVSMQVVGVFAFTLFIVGTYTMTYGSHGYEKAEKDLLNQMTSGYRKVNSNVLWNSKELLGDYKSNTKLIKTKSNPFRQQYTTNVFTLQAKSKPVKISFASDLICVETDVIDQKNAGNIYGTMKVFFDGIQVGESYLIRTGGKHLIYFKLPEYVGTSKEANIEIDMWKALPYHDDDRVTISQEYMPFHEDYNDVGVNINIISFETIFGKGTNHISNTAIRL